MGNTVPEMPKQGCVHRFKLIETVYSLQKRSSTLDYVYKRFDRFFCKKCLKIANVESASEEGITLPYWWPDKD